MILLTRESTRLIDKIAIQEIGIPGVVLMENAGARTADLLVQLNCQGKIIICCGKGNNGGDGYVIARYLFNQGLSVQIFLFANHTEITGDAKIHFDIVKKLNIPISVFTNLQVINAELFKQLQDADWIVDAIFGTGLTGEVKEPYTTIIKIINSIEAKVLAVDIPSGLDCTTGELLGCAVCADHTATFVAMKKGFLEPGAEKYLGKLHIIDIGIPRIILNNLT